MDWLNAAILGLLIIGHTTLWITFVNRTHALPLGRNTLRRLRHLHDAMLVLFPFVLVWFVGLRGPQLLLGGEWSRLDWFWRGYLGLCAGGLVWLGCVIFRTLTSRPPANLASNHSTYHDFEQELGHRPVHHGPYSWLSHVPLNEQFRVEFNQKELRLPSLPPALEGFTILHISDWHLAGTLTKDFYRHASELAAARPADLICFTGDLIDDTALVEWLPEIFEGLNARLGQYFILGNHDWYQKPDEIRRVLVDLGWKDVSNRVEVIADRGATFSLSGDESPWMGRHPPIPSDVNFRILLSHTPDHFAWAQSQKVELMLSGHNHGGQVRLPLIGPVYSPSRYGCKYASGTFWEPPTLLHVSRGLAGQHPLRWRCPPEISHLTLRSLRPDQPGAST